MGWGIQNTSVHLPEEFLSGLVGRQRRQVHLIWII